MNLVKLSGLALLTSVGLGQSLTQQPSRVVIDGAEVPASALQFVTGAPLVSCQWLDKNVSSLNCQSNPGTADYGAAAYIDENAEPLEGRDASGCCAEWRRSLSFRDGQLEYGRFETERGASPLPMLEVGRGATGSIGVGVPKGTATPSAATQFTLVDAFVPLRDVAFHMRMPWGVSGNTLSIGSSAGFKRTLEVIETGEVWEARIASRYFKFKPSLLKLPPQQADSSDPTLLIWPQGQVKKVFYIEGKTLDVLEFKNRRWETAYRARLKLAPIWLCSPSISNSRPAGFWAALGGIEHETGQRPIIAAPLSKYAACRLKTSKTNGAFGDTQFFSTLLTNGVDQPRLWLALEIFNANSGGFILNVVPVIDLTTRQLSNQSAPQSYEFMQEQRILRR